MKNWIIIVNIMIRVMTEKGLSGNALKVIAIVAMTIDHLAWVGIETYEQAETPTQIFLHCIGRLTFEVKS